MTLWGLRAALDAAWRPFFPERIDQSADVAPFAKATTWRRFVGEIAIDMDRWVIDEILLRLPYLGVVALFVDLLAAAHVVMYKRDSRSAVAWVGIIWLAPFVGAILYWILGINRIRRRAVRVRRSGITKATSPFGVCDDRELEQLVGPQAVHLVSFSRLVSQVTDRPLLRGNSAELFHNGDAAYPEMLAAIRAARHSVALSTYIFDDDPIGRQFVEALAEAHHRGVAVRAIVDDIGARYSWPAIDVALRKAGVPTSRFMQSLVPWRFAYANLRNHRKLLIIDGEVAFTGGLNIRIGHCLARQPKSPIVDSHFRLRGPVVAQLQEVFANDWWFCENESLVDAKWFPELHPVGDTLARGIPSGPDADYGKLRFALLGALSTARTSVVIVTPYFLPDAALITALNVAAKRGVVVEIVLPEKNNLALVKWASTALYWQLLEFGCRIWLTPGPFDHTKLVVMDGVWTLIGSSNWDPRSLRLNFEFNVECYDLDLAAQVLRLVGEKIAAAHQVTLEEVDNRSLFLRLRDGVARLFTPYL